ncbi:MAG: hypothetical protein RLY70_4190 [Planctomycetota bacterium]
MKPRSRSDKSPSGLMPYVFLNPDGTQETGLVVIVEHGTGVRYAQQCGGIATEIRAIEGFLVPVGGPSAAKKVYQWFWKRFAGHCSTGEVEWREELIAELATLIATIPCWLTRSNGKDERHKLELNVARIDECVEAWIPVLTPYGPGILTLDNSD